VSKSEAFLFARAVLRRRNPAQNCSLFTPTTALSLEVTFEKPEVGVPCLPTEFSHKYADSFVFEIFVGLFFLFFPQEDVEMTSDACLVH